MNDAFRVSIAGGSRCNKAILAGHPPPPEDDYWQEIAVFELLSGFLPKVLQEPEGCSFEKMFSLKYFRGRVRLPGNKGPYLNNSLWCSFGAFAGISRALAEQN